MPTVSISLTLSQAASAVVVTNILRSDNGSPPSGVTFPIALTNTTGNVWMESFNDPGAAVAYYTATGLITLNDGSQPPPFTWTINGSASPVTGFWTSQSQMEFFLGQFAADQLSNLNNTSTGASAPGFADAITQSESFINSELFLFNYPNGTTNPQFPTTSQFFPILSRCVTIMACGWLYSKRGTGYDEVGKEIAGRLGGLVKKAEEDIRRLIRNKLTDVPRPGITMQPSIVLNPAVAPYGTNNPWPLAPGMIPQLP